MTPSALQSVDLGGHLSCDYYSFYDEASERQGAEQAARRSWFEKLNFEAITRLVQREGIDCEYKDNGGGWEVYLTEEAFGVALRQIECLREAGGCVSSLKIFQGEEAAKVHHLLTCA